MRSKTDGEWAVGEDAKSSVTESKGAVLEDKGNAGVKVVVDRQVG